MEEVNCLITGSFIFSRKDACSLPCIAESDVFLAV
jgi:hypothetical protein